MSEKKIPPITKHKLTSYGQLGQYAREFLEYLEIEKGRSLRTVANYAYYLKRFFETLDAKKHNTSDITQAAVKSFRLKLNRTTTGNHGETMKKSTQNYHLIALRSFLKYLAKQDIKTLAAEKIELAKVGMREVDFIEGNELERLLAAPGTTPQKTILKLRDKAILELFFSTGLRVSELTSLKRDSINLKKDEFTIRGKGEKLRTVYLTHHAKHAIKEYLQARTDTDLALFIGHDRAKKIRDEDKDSQPLTPRSVERLIKKYAATAGITKQVTPHTLRHSFATDLLQNGADIRSVQAMLGHSSITTTQVYTHVTNKHLRDIHSKFHSRK